MTFEQFIDGLRHWQGSAVECFHHQVGGAGGFNVGGELAHVSHGYDGGGDPSDS